MTMQSTLGIPSAVVPARVVVAEPLALLRHCLASHLNDVDGLTVVGEAATGVEALEAARGSRPDLLVIDAAMTAADGLEVARVVKQDLPSTRVLVLTQDPRDHHVLEALRSGVDGYLYKDITPSILIDMIRAVLKGEKPITPVLMNQVVDGLAGTPASSEPPPELTLSHRELEIMQLVAQGMTNKEIARTLCITEGTVKNHVHHALSKLNMENRIQAAAYLVRQGFGTRRMGIL